MIEVTRTCKHCAQPFTQVMRRGRPSEFCADACRRDRHNATYLAAYRERYARLRAAHVEPAAADRAARSDVLTETALDGAAGVDTSHLASPTPHGKH